MIFDFSSEKQNLIWYYEKSKYLSISDEERFLWNPYEGSYYDSHLAEWDEEFGEYVEINSNYKNKKPEHKSWKHFVISYKDSEDEVKLAFIDYMKAYEKYYEENKQRIMLSSGYEVGQDGPLNIIKKLGIEKLPELLCYVEEENVFCIHAILAIMDMLKGEQFAPVDTSKEGIKVWKSALKDRLSSDEAKELIKEFKNNKDSGEKIKLKLNNLGVFALPILYDEIINKSNDDLLQYAIYALPDTKIKEYNIDENSSKKTVKDATASCGEIVEVLSSIK